jgi:hypothetical protein
VISRRVDEDVDDLPIANCIGPFCKFAVNLALSKLNPSLAWIRLIGNCPSRNHGVGLSSTHAGDMRCTCQGDEEAVRSMVGGRWEIVGAQGERHQGVWASGEQRQARPCPCIRRYLPSSWATMGSLLAGTNHLLPILRVGGKMDTKRGKKPDFSQWELRPRLTREPQRVVSLPRRGALVLPMSYKIHGA